MRRIYKPISRNGLGYSKVQTNSNPFLSTSSMKPSTSFKQRPSFQKSNKHHSNNQPLFFKRERVHTINHHITKDITHFKGETTYFYSNLRIFRTNNQQNFWPSYQRCCVDVFVVLCEFDILFLWSSSRGLYNTCILLCHGIVKN